MSEEKSTRDKLTAKQRDLTRLILRISLDSPDRWYRAKDHGERVTLPSLRRLGILVRRAWRGRDGDASAAYEYRIDSGLLDDLKSELSEEKTNASYGS